MGPGHSDHSHEHGHAHSHVPARIRHERPLWIAFALTLLFLLVEVAGGLLSNSLALLSDAAHMTTDVLALGIALFAVRMSRRPPDARRTYGYARMEAIGALANGGLLFVVAGFILWEALGRFRAPQAVASDAMLVVAVLGLLVNLASMRLLVDTLLNSQPINEQTAREYLELIAQENLRLSRLIDNFLAFSRMERNKYAFGFREVPAAAIVEGAVTAVRERFNAPGCQFKTEIAPDLPSVEADPDALVTALVNLLDNAYKYSGEQKQITLSASAADGSVRFAVRDNGIGLSARDTRRIFKRFFQVDQRLSRSGGGCGLGLSIVKYIVSAHRGNVRVESQPGRGSTFTLSLPGAVARAEEGQKPSSENT